MTDIDILKRAQEYIQKLSQGINPLTDEPTAESDVTRQPRIQNCLAYLAQYLSVRVTKEEHMCEPVRKGGFSITEEEKAALFSVDGTVYLKDMVDHINSVAAKKGCYKFQPKWLNDYLLNIGMLKIQDGHKIPTEEGVKLGITPIKRVSEKIGVYYVNTFSAEAQQFIMDNIDAVVAFANSENIPEANLTGGDGRFSNIVYPTGKSVEQFCQEHSDMCIIMSVGSCVIAKETGSYSSVLVYGGKSKFITKRKIKTRSANYCILQGMLDAVKLLKKSTDVLLLTSTPLGFNTKNSPNKSTCNEIMDELSAKGCSVYVVSCNGRGDELVNVVNSYRI